MRKLRQLSIVVMFMLALTPLALAGTTDTPPEPAPAPSAATSTGITDYPPINGQMVFVPTDLVGDVALNLLPSLLSVF
jgi:hypothetical protein